jgi:hypothetical protein
VASPCLLQSPLKLQILFPEPFDPRYHPLASKFHHWQLVSVHETIWKRNSQHY